MKTTLASTHGVFRFGLKNSVKSLKENPKKESLIMMHFASKGKRFKKSIGFKSSLHHWDSTKQRVKTGKGMMANAYKINAFLNDVQAFAEEELSNMVKKDSTININRLSELIGQRINGTENEEAVNENGMLVHYSENLLESKKKRIGATTYRSYNQTIRLLKLYEKQYKTILTFDWISRVN